MQAPATNRLPLHSNPPTKLRTTLQRLLAHFNQAIDPASPILELELLLLALAFGIQDAISFLVFHGLASNQTGNTVLFAVGILLNDREHGTLFSVATIPASLSLFIIGVSVTGQMANYFDINQTR